MKHELRNLSDNAKKYISFELKRVCMWQQFVKCNDDILPSDRYIVVRPYLLIEKMVPDNLVES